VCRKAPGFEFPIRQLRDIDLPLDPTFLLVNDVGRFILRKRMELGQPMDECSVIKNTFGSQCVLCELPMIVNRLKKDPRFEELSPAKLEKLHITGNIPYLFGLKDAS
jgi:hypothetical protein